MYGPRLLIESYRAVSTAYVHSPRSLTVRTHNSGCTNSTRSYTSMARNPHAVDVQLANPVTGVARCLDISAAVAITGIALLITKAGGVAEGTRSRSFVLELDERPCYVSVKISSGVFRQSLPICVGKELSK